MPDAHGRSPFVTPIEAQSSAEMQHTPGAGRVHAANAINRRAAHAPRMGRSCLNRRDAVKLASDCMSARIDHA
jgi:hypothetical protein